MNDRKEVAFKPTIFSNLHKLVLDREFIELYKSKDDQNPVRISNLEFDAFRFGVKWIRGYRTIFGRVNCIDIRSSTNVIIKIRLTSLYKIHLKPLNKKYREIVNTILKFYASEIIGHYLKLFNNKLGFTIITVDFSKLNIKIDDEHIIEWNDIDLKSFTRYIVISKKSDPNFYKGFDYWEDWNTVILYNVLRLILESKTSIN